MENKPSPSRLQLIVAFMLAASLTLIGGAVWMIATDQGAPALVAAAGAMLAACAAIIGSKIKKKP